MKIFLKKVTALLIAVSCSLALFAEPASTGLTDSDVKNFAKNYVAIYEALDDYGFSSITNFSGKVSDLASAEAILGKFGISGPNRVEKLSMIGKCLVVVAYDTEIEKDPAGALMLKKLGMDPIAEQRAQTNSKDLKVVKANYSSLEKIYKDSEQLDKKAKSKDKAKKEPKKKADKNSFTGMMTSAIFGDDLSEEDEEAAAMMEEMFNKSPANQFVDDALKEIKSSVDTLSANGKTIEKYYENLKSAKGDCGLQYTSLDKKNASLYKSEELKITKGDKNFNIYNSELFKDDPDNAIEKISFDLITKKGLAEFSFFNTDWDTLSKSKNLLTSGFDQTKYFTKKTIKLTATKIELYSYKDTAKKGDSIPTYGREYVITTKEGVVIHALDTYDSKTGKSTKLLMWKGLDAPIPVSAIGLESLF